MGVNVCENRIFIHTVPSVYTVVDRSLSRGAYNQDISMATVGGGTRAGLESPKRMGEGRPLPRGVYSLNADA